MTKTAKAAKPYTPRPDTLADKLIKHLATAPGHSMFTTNIAAEFGAEIKNIHNMLNLAVQRGALVRDTTRSDGVNRQFYALPGAPAPQANGSTPRRSSHRGVVLTELAPKPLALTRWPDDDISLTGFHISEDGQTVMLNRDMVRQLVDFVCGAHTPADPDLAFRF